MGLENFLGEVKMKNQVMAIMVIYQKKIEEINLYPVLCEALKKGYLQQLMIYDNSIEGQNCGTFLKDGIEYIHDKSNSGLAKAYNKAFRKATEYDVDLLMLLDHDTEIELDYFKTLTELEIGDDVGAILPIVQVNGNQISPVYTDEYISVKSKMVSTGIIKQSLMAINSGSTIPVKVITEIGGFNEDFPLDFLDHWIFWRLNNSKKMYIVLNQIIEHDLSVLDYNKVSQTRYESIVKAESLYYRNYNKEKLDLHRKHLNKRVLKQFLTVKNRKIYKTTIMEMISLARSSKK